MFFKEFGEDENRVNIKPAKFELLTTKRFWMRNPQTAKDNS